MRRVIFTVVLLSLTAPLTAQTTFRRTYGHGPGRSVAQTTDGGYIIADYTLSPMLQPMEASSPGQRRILGRRPPGSECEDKEKP